MLAWEREKNRTAAVFSWRSIMSTTSTSGAITFTGLGSGTDFASMIDKLVAVEQTRITSLETWRTSWTDKIEAFQELNTQMLSLKTALEGMDTTGEFLVKTAGSSDGNVLSATAGADAQEGTHAIEVKQIAKNKIMATTDGVATTTESINTSGASRIFAYVYEGKTYSVAVPAGASLTDLKNLINIDGDNPGVKAAIVNDGTAYHLQLRGMDTGAESTLEISDTTTLAGYGSSDFTTSQTNQDALLKVDGWPATYMSRATNSISDVIEGVTLNLRSAGEADLDIETDLDSVKENIETFVEQVNAVRTMIIDLTKVTTTGSSVSTSTDSEQTQIGSLLTGNYGIQLISSRLKDATAGSAIGFDWATDPYTSLSSIGIMTDAQEGSVTAGLLVIDDEVLDAALEKDIDAVASLFSADYEGSTNSSDFSYASHIQGITEAGTYKVAYTVSGGVITSATINGHEAKISGNTILGQGKGNPENGLLLEIKNLTDGSYSGTSSMKLGKTGELINNLGDLTDSDTGPLAILEDNYNDITDMIDKKIEYEENRITLMESRLRERYARLDALLGYYDNISTSLESQIADLDE
ncbi:flagellar filament capping protein FliD [Desulfovibrio sulfodismutans]|uniref:Flagellar hook-associated protein 2 n=2 Tax=Desulfolutivibrio sulfodismutans TaxID=63561 RepID=A0A7K3NME6_9BACT|nr:flagellar filament capping protein FliD [Desulfolutivibrio sulfodismutans]QLA12447.1 flagellar filament capping protein FliD [Desulfolutivibrio sulfodismutans DSM 3696]